MLALIAILFVVTTGSSSTLDLLHALGVVSERQMWPLTNITSQLSLFNNTFNDFLYFVMSAHFRNTCTHLLRTCCRQPERRPINRSKPTPDNQENAAKLVCRDEKDVKNGGIIELE